MLVSSANSKQFEFLIFLASSLIKRENNSCDTTRWTPNVTLIN